MYRICLGIVFALLFLAGTFFGIYGVSFAVDGIIPGVHVGPVNLGGLTREEAQRELDTYSTSIETLPVQIDYNADSRHLTAGELGIKLDVDTSLKEAEQVGNTGSIFNRLTERQQVKHQGMYIKPALIMDQQQLESKINQIWQNVSIEPENAGFKVLSDDSVTIVPGRLGTKIDIDTLAKDMIKLIPDNHMGKIEVNLPVLTVTPLRTTQDIESMKINGLIAQYSTQFNSSQVGRTYNIKVAAAALDGLLIAPGDEFSFNRVVGPRSSEAGYKNANVIINNELVEGLGGGVCQVSSTLYNAILLANLKVVERSNHSLPVSYVPIGLDATVVYDAVDFKFANNTDFYIYLRSIVDKNTLTVKIYGNKEKTPRVELSSWVTQKIEPNVTYEQDPNLAEGEKVVKQEGNNGFKAAAVRHIWKEGEKVEEALLSSFYHPVHRIVAVGTGEASPSVIVPLDQDLKPPVINQPVPVEPETPTVGESEEGLLPGEEIENENKDELLPTGDIEEEDETPVDDREKDETLPVDEQEIPDELQPSGEKQEQKEQDEQWNEDNIHRTDVNTEEPQQNNESSGTGTEPETDLLQEQ